MGMRRTHIMLEPEQHQKLAEIAHRERRSVSDVTREIVQQGIVLRQQEYEEIIRQKRQAFEHAKKVGEEIIQKRGGKEINLDIVALINEMREER